MERVLIVDDEEDMLWMLQRNLSKGLPNVEVLAAKSAEEALAILSDKSANLIISDINMPGMSGLDLLTEVNNRYPETSVVIMTAYPSNAYENEAMLSGCLRFIEKPFDIKEMRQIVDNVLKRDERFQGTIDGIDLLDIVQFNGLSGASAALKVTTIEEEGMIFFKSGQVLHAMCGSLTGEEAFFKVLAFQGGTLQNMRGVEPPVVSIEKDLQTLLFEAAVLNDELNGEETTETTSSPIAGIDMDSLESNPNDSPVAALSDSAFEVDDALEQVEDLAVQFETPLEEEIQVQSEAEPVPVAEPEPKPNASQERQAPRNQTKETENTINTDATLTQTEDLEMTDIQQILAEFTNIEGVHTACLVGRDGFLLDNIARTGIDAEMIGAIASSGFGSAESMGNQLGQGDLNMTMLEYENGPVMFAPVGTEAFLVIVADQETNLGWIRIAIKKNSKKIQEVAAL